MPNEIQRTTEQAPGLAPLICLGQNLIKNITITIILTGWSWEGIQSLCARWWVNFIKGPERDPKVSEKNTHTHPPHLSKNLHIIHLMKSVFQNIRASVSSTVRNKCGGLTRCVSHLSCWSSPCPSEVHSTAGQEDKTLVPAWPVSPSANPRTQQKNTSSVHLYSGTWIYNSVPSCPQVMQF